MEMKVLSQEVPCHARVYPGYSPIMGRNTARELLIFYKEDVQKEIDDGDGNSDYENEEAPLAVINRAHIIAGIEEHKDCEHSVLNHSLLLYRILDDERHICANGWGIKDLKIFHIWNISLGNKPQSHWSVKCLRETNTIEIQINDGEYGTKLVDFNLDTQECDKSLSVTVDDCEVNYSLFSDAFRVELEIRPYDADGNPVLNVNGHVHASIILGKTAHEKILFSGESKHEKSQHISATHALVLRDSILISPCGIADFTLDLSLNGNDGKFQVTYFTRILRRSIAIDEQHYMIGQEGYIILTIKWGCLCVDQGVCICPFGTVVGDIAAFQATYNYDSSDDYSDDSSDDESPVRICKEDGRKRSKITRRISSSSSSQETTCDEEDNEDSASQEATSTCDEEDSASQETTCDEEDSASQETTCDEEDGK